MGFLGIVLMLLAGAYVLSRLIDSLPPVSLEEGDAVMITTIAVIPPLLLSATAHFAAVGDCIGAGIAIYMAIVAAFLLLALLALAFIFCRLRRSKTIYWMLLAATTFTLVLLCKFIGLDNFLNGNILAFQIFNICVTAFVVSSMKMRNARAIA